MWEDGLSNEGAKDRLEWFELSHFDQVITKRKKQIFFYYIKSEAGGYQSFNCHFQMMLSYKKRRKNKIN